MEETKPKISNELVWLNKRQAMELLGVSNYRQFNATMETHNLIPKKIGKVWKWRRDVIENLESK